MSKKLVINAISKTGTRSVSKLYEYLKHSISKEKIKEIVSRLAATQTTVKLKFPKATHQSTFPDHKWYFDLIDLKGASLRPRGFLLTIIDHYSRYAFVRYLKDKQAKTVYDAFKPIYDKHRPLHLIADKGSEWSLINKFHNIHYGKPGNKYDNSPIERFNRSILEKLKLYFLLNSAKGWKDNLQNLIDSYNNEVHSATKEKPKHIYSGKKHSKFIHKTGRWNLSPGDNVRLVLDKNKFSKGAREATLGDLHKFIRITNGLYELDNGKLYKQREIYPVSNLKPINEKRVEKTESRRKQHAREKLIKSRITRSGIDETQITEGKRTRKPNSKFKDFI